METISDIVREMRERCIDKEHSPTLWPYLDRIEAAHEREIKHLLANVYGVASWIRGLTSTSMARERGISASEVGNIAVKLEVLADKAGREVVVSKNATTTFVLSGTKGETK